MTNTTVGREPIHIVEIVQPLCANVIGSAPCTATETGDAKCYNTRSTCLDTANYDGSSTLSLYFSNGEVAEQTVSGAPYIIPSLVSVSTTPTRVNLASSNPDATGLGNRALCRIQFKDHPHTDRRVDPYLGDRTFDPFERASFWTKWLARNKYRTNIQVHVYEGYEGEALGSMLKRTYFLESVSGPDGQGNVTIQCKDILARIEERKAQAPIASAGELYADITNSATSFEVAGVTTADYPATGTLRINEELMTYTARTTSTNGIEFTGVVRGTDGTTAAEHSAEDSVQECLRYTDARVDDVLEDLLQNYGGIAASFLDTTNWATEVSDYLSLYLLNTVISEPRSVTELVSQIQDAAGCFIWWDEYAALVKFKAIRGIDAELDILTEETHILEGSFSMQDRPRERASQIWIYYGHKNFVDSIEEAKSYRFLSVFADLESETDDLYGQPSIRKIFSPWLNSGALADTTASKLIVRFVDVPRVASFRLDAKDRDYDIGDVVQLSHHLDVDTSGQRILRNWTIVSTEWIEPGHIKEYLVEDTTLYGRIHYVMASGAADYPGYDTAPFKNCYIGDANGLLSDGEPCGRISG